MKHIKAPKWDRIEGLTKSFLKLLPHLPNCPTERELKIIEMFLLGDMNYVEISRELELSTERVRQIIDRGLGKIRRLSDGSDLIKLEKNTNEKKILEAENSILKKKLLKVSVLSKKAYLAAEPMTTKDIPLEDLDISVRGYNILKAAKINTLNELALCKKSEIMRFRNIGKKTMMEIEQLLNSFGFDFD